MPIKPKQTKNFVLHQSQDQQIVLQFVDSVNDIAHLLQPSSMAAKHGVLVNSGVKVFNRDVDKQLVDNSLGIAGIVNRLDMNRLCRYAIWIYTSTYVW